MPRFSFPVFLTYMKNTHKQHGNVSEVSGEKKGNKAAVTKLPRMEMYVVLGLELNKQIIERLGKIEDSVDILARQKKRELTPETPAEQSAQSPEQAGT
jgi:hypothetical protein